MVATPTQSRILKFALFEVDLEAGELRKSGMRQKIAGQPFEVLRLLLERPQEIVTREELQQRIWPKDTFVDYDLALRKAITRLREVLGDSAESPRFIETIPRRGYRFIAPLNRNGDAHALAELLTEGAPAETQRSRRSLQIGIALGLGVAALLLALLGFVPDKFRWLRSGRSAVPQIRSIAVLPLRNLSADPTQEYFSDGMTDALITDLAQISSLKVISGTSTMRYKKTDKSLPEIARELDVDGIVEGTVQRSGDRVRITAQLIQGTSDKHFWANSYERDIRDVFALERGVASEIVLQIQSRLTPENPRPPRPPPQPRLVKPEALEAYLQGNYYLNRQARGFGDEAKGKAAEYFQQAIDADPNFAAAYDGLANAHGGLMWPSKQDAEIARRAADRAVELDPDSSDARTTLGSIKMSIWDFHGAEEQYRRALALNPNNANAHDGFSDWLGAMGRMDAAVSERQIAQQLDPAGDHLPCALYQARDYDRAIATYRTLIQGDPDNGYFHYGLSRSYAAKGMYNDSIVELEKTTSLVGIPEVGARIHHAFVVSGYRGAMQQYARELESLIAVKQLFRPVDLGEIYTLLGDKDRAFYWLEQAYSHHDTDWVDFDFGLETMKAEPLLDPLRSDPRYKDLLRRVGLPP